MTTDTGGRYRGRFAPSPSGPLHFGSLVAAVGSYLDARAHHGEWLVRIENLDPPREVAGAAESILRTLDAFGLGWDGEVVYQGRRADRYRQALEQLRAAGHTYPCACSRRDIRLLTAAGAHPQRYPGTCRNGLPPGRKARAIRLRTPDLAICFDDRLQGEIRECLPQTCGDFILQRADGLFAYQLAVVVDDGLQAITHVVRGADLLDSTPRQILLQQLLGLPTPRYLHLPVAADRHGKKLGKQTQAPPVDTDHPVATLGRVMAFLGHPPPETLTDATLDEFWRWAVNHWNIARLPPRLLVNRH